MKIAIYDRDELRFETLRIHLLKYGDAHGTDMQVVRFADSDELCRGLEREAFPLIFADAQISGDAWGRIVRRFRALCKEARLVFLLPSGDTAADAPADGIYFLRDAMDMTALEAEIDAFSNVTAPKGNTVLVRTGHPGMPRGLLVDDIRYIEQAGTVCRIGYRTETVECPDKAHALFTAAENAAPDGRFVLVFRGVLVNARYVVRLTDDSVTLSDGTKFPVSAHRLTHVRNALVNYRYDKNRDV